MKTQEHFVLAVCTAYNPIIDINPCATVSKKWEISKKWEKVGLFCGANFQIIFENRQILDTQAKLESKIERCFD